MPRWLPVDQVLARAQWHAREEGERGVDEVIGVTHATKGWVWVETCQHRVVVLVALVDFHVEAGIGAGLLEVVELGCLCMSAECEHTRKW